MMRATAVLVVACAFVALAAACPPFDTLPFPAGEGEGEGEGEGGEGSCPAVAQPTCTTAFAAQLDDWQPTKLTQTNDGGIGALAVDATTSPPTIIAGNFDGELYRFDPSTGAVPILLATCNGSTGGAGPVIARRIFVASDGTVIASGTNGVCLVDGDGANLFVTFLGDASSENALVPVGAGDDLLAVSITGTTFHFLHDTHTGSTLNSAADFVEQPLPPGGGTVVDAIPDGGGNGALVVDEEGDVYFVDAAFTGAKLVATLPASAPSGVAFAALADDLEVALMTSSDVEYGAFSLASLEGLTTPASALTTKIARSSSRFTSAIDHITNVAMRASDAARLDVGVLSYATYTAVGDASGPAPIGGCARVSALNDLAGLRCGTLWGVTSTGGVVAWDPDAARTAAVSFSASATGTTLNFAPTSLTALDDTHALLASGAGFSVLTRDAANQALIDVVDVSSGIPAAAGFAMNAAALAGSAASGANGAIAVAVGVDGTTVKSFAPFDVDPASTLLDIVGTLGTDASSTEGQVVVVNDPNASGDTTAAFFAAGFIAGTPSLLHCSVDLAGHTFTCADSPPVSLTDIATASSFSTIAFTSTGAVVVVSDQGVEVSVDNGATASLVGFGDIDTTNGTPWQEGAGRVVDAGNGCVLVTGFSARPFVFDAFDPAPAFATAGVSSSNPFPTVATLLDDGRVLASGGNGASFYSIDFDVNGASAADPCAVRFSQAHASLSVLGPNKTQGDLLSATFVGDDAFAGDDRGFLWKLPRFSP